jgi:putative ABC transport system permease protein
MKRSIRASVDSGMISRSAFAASLGVGIQMLRANPMRTMLSALGVIMGVASLVAVLAIGDGVEAFAREQIENTTDLQALMVSPTMYDTMDDLRVPRTDYPVFTLADLSALQDRLRNQAVVALISQGSSRVVADTGRTRGASVTATTPAAALLIRKALAAGRFFNEGEVRDSSRVVVISSGLSDAISKGTPAAAMIGKLVRMESADFRVIGVAQNDPRGSSLAAFVPVTVEASALAPSPTPRTPSLFVRAVDIEKVPAVKTAVEAWLTQRLGSWKARASVSGGQGQRLEQARQVIRIFKILMGTFAGISLVVGGIGIMNVLLASVIERTREIGIRKAAGARNRDIMVQFLAESVAITGMGSAIGALAGLSVAFAAAAVMRLQTKAEVHAAFTWTTFGIATLVAFVTGLAFGTYPALRASRLSPIDAIRHE